MNKKRIIFVDDESRVLEGLKRMLHPHRKEWDVDFALSAAEALEKMEASPFDVVVSDMRMPGMDGAALLHQIQESSPEVVRIILSGYSEMEAALRAVPVAHQFLSKPCSAEELYNTVRRASDLSALLNNAELVKMVGSIRNLPTLPAIYEELSQAIRNPETSVEDVSRIVEQDVGMIAQILHIVNSAFFGLAHRMTSVQAAVGYLGLNTVKNLTLGVEVFQIFDGKKLDRGLLESTQYHSFLVASLARAMLDDKTDREDAMVSGLLHDVGKLVLMTAYPEEFREMLREQQEKGTPLHEIEHARLGVTHADVGAYLLGLWGLPYRVVEAVAYHHVMDRIPGDSWDGISAVYLANRLVLSEPGKELDEKTLEFLRSRGVSGELEKWRAECDRLCGAEVAGE